MSEFLDENAEKKSENSQKSSQENKENSQKNGVKISQENGQNGQKNGVKNEHEKSEKIHAKLGENALLSEFDKKERKRARRREILRFLALAACVLVLAYYVGETLFGASSYDTMRSLSITKRDLEQRIEHYKAQNSELQKRYFELKGLQPNEK